MRWPAPRKLFLWALSLAAAALWLWGLSHVTDVLPRDVPAFLSQLDARWLAAALALQVPYAVLRGMRLGYLLDGMTPCARFPRDVLLARSMLSFAALWALPFKLGEMHRPLVLAQAGVPGVQLGETSAAVVMERTVDGLAVCALVVLGLTGSVGMAAWGVENFARSFAAMAALFLVMLAVLLGWAVAPTRVATLANATLGRVLRRDVGAVVLRMGQTLAALMHARKAAAFTCATAVYWAVTVAQLFCVALASGLALHNVWAAAAVVGLVGLSIQLPGGPAQVGTFQAGVLASLWLLQLDKQPGAAAFGPAMYGITVVGTLAMALVGALWLAHIQRARG